MVSVASGGAADRIAMRILLKVLRAGSGIPARYSSTFFGAPLAFAAELGPPDFTFFMPEMLQKLPLQVHPQPPYVYRQTATESVEPQCHHGVHARRTSCRHVASERRHDQQHRRRDCQGRRVRRAPMPSASASTAMPVNAGFSLCILIP